MSREFLKGTSWKIIKVAISSTIFFFAPSKKLSNNTHDYGKRGKILRHRQFIELIHKWRGLKKTQGFITSKFLRLWNSNRKFWEFQYTYHFTYQKFNKYFPSFANKPLHFHYKFIKNYFSLSRVQQKVSCLQEFSFKCTLLPSFSMFSLPSLPSCTFQLTTFFRHVNLYTCIKKKFMKPYLSL